MASNVPMSVMDQRMKLVLDCQIWRLTAEETQAFLKQRGHDVDVRTIKRYKQRLKKNASKWITDLAVSRRIDYVSQYQNRINEIEQYQRELWKIVHDKSTRSHARVEAIGKLLDCTLRLSEIYAFLPRLIDSMPADKDNGKIIPYDSIKPELDDKDDSRVFA